jgi:hypothetical protein
VALIRPDLMALRIDDLAFPVALAAVPSEYIPIGLHGTVNHPLRPGPQRAMAGILRTSKRNPNQGFRLAQHPGATVSA